MRATLIPITGNTNEIIVLVPKTRSEYVVNVSHLDKKAVEKCFSFEYPKINFDSKKTPCEFFHNRFTGTVYFPIAK